MSKDTIYALGTGAGRAAIAVIRLSGPCVQQVLVDFAGGLPSARRAAFVRFRAPQSGETLDQGLALWFPAPASATGEDYAEFQIHGGRAVVDAFLRALRARPDLREAEPGEFARRGFANGKFDLSQAEALADLIDAQTEFQRRQAIRVAGGELRRKVEGWRSRIIDLMALVEAELDFSDEEDVGAAPAAALAASLPALIAEMRHMLRAAPASERLRDGFTVLILGPPNAGKSTLINALAQRDLAIVSPAPGTTRDMIEAHLDIGGMPVTFVDTAGLREAGDEIEAIGIERVLERSRHADLLLWLSENGAPPPVEQFGGEWICVATKADLGERHRAGSDAADPAGQMITISARTGQGLDRLFQIVGERAKSQLGDGSSALLIRERHRSAVEAAVLALEAAARPNRPLEIVADDLRAGGRSLGRIVGAIDVEDVLDAVFSRFCIGK